MTFEELDQALEQASAAGWSPLVFKIHVWPVAGIAPSATASRKGIPIDPTSSASYLLCTDGQTPWKVMIDGEW